MGTLPELPLFLSLSEIRDNLSVRLGTANGLLRTPTPELLGSEMKAWFSIPPIVALDSPAIPS
jgi:hypothetical protein